MIFLNVQIEENVAQKPIFDFSLHAGINLASAWHQEVAGIHL